MEYFYYLKLSLVLALVLGIFFEAEMQQLYERFKRKPKFITKENHIPPQSSIYQGGWIRSVCCDDCGMVASKIEQSLDKPCQCCGSNRIKFGPQIRWCIEDRTMYWEKAQ
jgi:hypothetical protein